MLDSVRIAGTVVDAGDLLKVDLTITSRGDCDGTIRVGGGKAQLRRVGPQTWFQANEKFWIASTDATQGPVIAALVGARWVEFPGEEAASFDDVCDLDELLESTNDAVVGDNLGLGTVAGREVVQVDTGDAAAGGDSSVAAVSVAEPHYILELDGGPDGSFRFSEFDESPPIEPPAPGDIFDLEGFGG